jgi:ribosomal protein S18 acetylase RimI-like enzyme
LAACTAWDHYYVQLPPSARDLTDAEWELVEFARATIDATTDAGPNEDGVHTMGAAIRATDGRMFTGVNLYHALIDIRRAAPVDAPALAAVHVASWQATYRGVIADEVLDGPELSTNRLQLWQRVLGTDAPRGHMTFIAERPAVGAVAFVNVGPTRDEDGDGSTGEVVALYARPAAWGIGAGRELMTTGLRALREAGFSAATLWVLDSNARARRFYAQAGFAPDGTTKDAVFAGASITEVRYRCDF